MLIWDYIRDFIVQNITGGHIHDGTSFVTTLGTFDLFTKEGALETTELVDSDYNMFLVGKGGQFNYYIGMNDWLATTLTIICMCLIVAFAIWLVIWVFKAVAHAFLLRR